MRNTTKGWLCVSGGMINLSLSYFSYTLVILFLPLLAEQLGCSLAQASLIFTTSAIASMVASMFLGLLWRTTTLKVCISSVPPVRR